MKATLNCFHGPYLFWLVTVFFRVCGIKVNVCPIPADLLRKKSDITALRTDINRSVDQKVDKWGHLLTICKTPTEKSKSRLSKSSSPYSSRMDSRLLQTQHKQQYSSINEISQCLQCTLRKYLCPTTKNNVIWIYIYFHLLSNVRTEFHDVLQRRLHTEQLLEQGHGER